MSTTTTTRPQPARVDEDASLNYLRKTRKPVEITLTTENTIRCVVVSFTRFTVDVVDISKPRRITLFKHAIASMETDLNAEKWKTLTARKPGLTVEEVMDQYGDALAEVASSEAPTE